MKNKKIVILTIAVILIISVVAGIYFIDCKRKVVIIRDLSEKREQLLKKDNYYQKITQYTNTAKIITKYYQKGEKSITFVDTIINDSEEVVKEIIYFNNGKYQTYKKGKEEVLRENSTMTFLNMFPVNIDHANSTDKEILDSLKKFNISINDTIYNNKDCYIYTVNTDGGSIETYFEKETGLVLKYAKSEYEYEFDNVDDKIFEQDLSEYTLVE